MTFAGVNDILGETCENWAFIGLCHEMLYDDYAMNTIWYGFYDVQKLLDMMFFFVNEKEKKNCYLM